MIICQTRRSRVLGFRLADVIVHLECPEFYIGGLGNRYLALYVSLAGCRVVTVVGFGYSGVILAEDFFLLVAGMVCWLGSFFEKSSGVI